MKIFALWILSDNLVNATESIVNGLNEMNPINVDEIGNTILEHTRVLTVHGTPFIE